MSDLNWESCLVPLGCPLPLGRTIALSAHVEMTWCYPDYWCDCCHESVGHRKVWVDESGEPVKEEAER